MQVGAFELSDSSIFEARATLNEQAIASFQFHPSFTLPGWWRIPSPAAQWSENGAIQVTEVICWPACNSAREAGQSQLKDL